MPQQKCRDLYVFDANILVLVEVNTRMSAACELEEVPLLNICNDRDKRELSTRNVGHIYQCARQQMKGASKLSNSDN